MIRSIRSDFSHFVQTQPSKVAIINRLAQKSHIFTYAQFYELAQRILAFYESNNLNADDIVVSLLPNSLEKFTLFFATAIG